MSKRSQILNMLRDVSFEQTLAEASIDTPASGNLWNNLYYSPGPRFWWDLTLGSWRDTYPRPLPIQTPSPKQWRDSFSFPLQISRTLCYFVSLTLFNKPFPPPLVYIWFLSCIDWSNRIFPWVLGPRLPASLWWIHVNHVSCVCL